MVYTESWCWSQITLKKIENGTKLEFKIAVSLSALKCYLLIIWKCVYLNCKSSAASLRVLISTVLMLFLILTRDILNKKISCANIKAILYYQIVIILYRDCLDFIQVIEWQEYIKIEF